LTIYVHTGYGVGHQIEAKPKEIGTNPRLSSMRNSKQPTILLTRALDFCPARSAGTPNNITPNLKGTSIGANDCIRVSGQLLRPDRRIAS
jgi:hypothetical protein